MGVIMRILGPAVTSESHGSIGANYQRYGGNEDAGANFGHQNKDGSSLENARHNTKKAFWTGRGQASGLDLGSDAGYMFLGKKAFPEQFSGWGDPSEDEMPVVVNTVDMRPLDAYLPKADILMAILSGASEVRMIQIR